MRGAENTMPGRGNSLSEGPKAGTGSVYSGPSKEACAEDGRGGISR